MSVTLEVSKGDKSSPVNALQEKNMSAILVTLAVLKVDKSISVNFSLVLNISDISVTFEVLNLVAPLVPKLMLVKFLLLANIFAILVTAAVSRHETSKA